MNILTFEDKDWNSQKHQHSYTLHYSNDQLEDTCKINKRV